MSDIPNVPEPPRPQRERGRIQIQGQSTNDTNDAPATRPVSGNRRTIPMTEGATASASRENRKAIPVSCALHRGPVGFANLVVERKRDGEIVLDPHVTGACVIILDEAAATALFDVLGKWLG